MTSVPGNMVALLDLARRMGIDRPSRLEPFTSMEGKPEDTSLAAWVAHNITESDVFAAWWAGLSEEERQEVAKVRAAIEKGNRP